MGSTIKLLMVKSTEQQLKTRVLILNCGKNTYLPVLKSMIFVDPKTGKHQRPPTIKNWEITIRS